VKFTRKFKSFKKKHYVHIYIYISIYLYLSISIYDIVGWVYKQLCFGVVISQFKHAWTDLIRELTRIWLGISWDIWPTISNLGLSESRVPHSIHWLIVVHFLGIHHFQTDPYLDGDGLQLPMVFQWFSIWIGMNRRVLGFWPITTSGFCPKITDIIEYSTNIGQNSGKMMITHEPWFGGLHPTNCNFNGNWVSVWDKTYHVVGSLDPQPWPIPASMVGWGSNGKRWEEMGRDRSLV